MSIDVFICSRTKTYCYKCGKRTETRCTFPFRGKMAGQVCDKLICSQCAVNKGKHCLCPPHSKIEIVE